MKKIFGLAIFISQIVSAQNFEDVKNVEATIKLENKNIIPDYSDLFYWAAHPLKKDPSDSIPAFLKREELINYGVDVFFIHPTTYTSNDFKNWNAGILNQELNNKTDFSTILYQASAFNSVGSIYSPRYRQAHIKAFYIEPTLSKPYFDTAYDDIKKAFIYYLENYNNDKPIIIAAHSQGTKHAGKLLKEFFENKPLQKKLVCAYIIGMPIPDNYFTTIPVCENSDQTGCYVGWRTYKKEYVPEEVSKEKFKSVVVNPLTWKTSDEYVSSNKNKGGVLKQFNKLVPGVVDAQIHGNILWSSKPDVLGKIFITQKNYHIGDINLFYMNIRENAVNRCKQYFLSKNQL